MFKFGRFSIIFELLLTNYDDIISNIVYLPPFGKSYHVNNSFDLKLSYTALNTKFETILNKGDYMNFNHYMSDNTFFYLQ